MMYHPHSFIVPSVILHVCALGAVLLLSLNAPTLKSPVEQHFQVKLVRATPAPSQPAAAVVQETIQPQPEKKTVTRQPAVEKRESEPEPKKAVQPEPEPVKKEIVKIDKPTVAQNVLEMPDHIRRKQQEFIAKREQARKKKVTREKRTMVEKEPEPVKREVTVGKTRLSTETTSSESSRTFETLQEKLETDRRSITSRMRSSVNNVRVSSSARGAEQQRIDDFFRSSIQTAIDASWIRPSSSLVPLLAKCIIGFRLSRTGRASSIRVLRSSGYSALDESARSAIGNARFPAFPEDIKREYLDVEVPFECEPDA